MLRCEHASFWTLTSLPVLARVCLDRTALPPAGEGTAYVKWESMQATGSFKARGAVHKVLGLSAEQLAAGVVTSSTGNHALAVVYACSLMQRRPGEHGPRQPWRQPLAVATGALEATASAAAVASASGRGDETSTSPPLLRPPRVFLAHSAAPHKVARLRSLGAVIVQVGADCVEAELAARSEAEACGAVYISPYNDLQVVGGQGTIGLELLAELGPGRLDAVLVPVGAGGLIAGA